MRLQINRRYARRAAIAGAVLTGLSLVAAPAQAIQSGDFTGTVVGTASPLVADGTCPVNPYFPDWWTDQHQTYTGTVGSDGPTRNVKVDFCTVFDGAMGGRTVKGTFALQRPGGTASGTAAGAFIYVAAPQHVVIELTITDATKGLKSTIGQKLYFTAGLVDAGGPLSNARISVERPQ